MLGPEWIVANVHLAYEYRARYIGGSVSSACSGDLLTLLELLKSEPLAAMGSCPLGAPRPGRIVAVSPRRWWDAEGGEAAFPHASVVGLQSSRRGVPIDIFPSLGPASPWLIFKLRWQAATGLALPESAQEASVGLNTPAPMLPEPTPYDCPRPLLAYTPNQCPTAGETVPICLTADESAGPVTVELHRLHSWCSEVGLHTQRIECPTVDSVQLSPWRQPPVCGSYGSARITINHRSSAPMVCTNQIDRPTSLMSLINAGDGLTIVVTVWPTAPRKTAVQESVQTYFAKDSTQVLMSIGDGASAVSLVLTPLGSAALRVGKQVVANTKVALAPREWCTIAASLTDTTATLVQKPLSLMAEPICVRETWRGCAGAALVMVAIEEEAADQNWNRQKLEAEHSEEPGRRDHELETLVMFAAAMGEHGPCEHYNGKLSSPALWAVGLDVGTALAYRKRQQYGELPPRPEEALGMTGLIATWDFSLALSLSPACGEQATVPGQRKRQQQEQQLVLDNGANMVVDVGPNGHHGELYNCPARGVTGPRWAAAALAGDTNAEQSWQHSALHDAVHFHEDDVGDFGWSSDFSIDTTALESGVYGVRLEQGRWHDWVSFFVRRPPLQASAHGDRTAREAEGASPPVVFLAPTASYLAYACNTFAAQEGAELAGGGAGTGFIDATYCFLHSNPYYGFSCYDLHADGSGVAYMSLLRPQFLMHRGDLAGQFEDDSRLVSFLTHKSIDHDVVTDTHLHCDGVACLAAYRCVITGTHPEYYSSKMLAAVQEFTSTGGRLLYLGANGFCESAPVSLLSCFFGHLCYHLIGLRLPSLKYVARAIIGRCVV
eukprot:SAG31_NODE_118_length_24006_cov_8.219266_9_plen_834_part_00